jgi:phospholipid transport system substrate-binding protein
MKKHIVIILSLILALFCFNAFAAAPEPRTEPGKLIIEAINNVLEKLMDPSIRIPGLKQEALISDIEKIIYEHVDFEEFCARAVGASWRNFTPDQRQAFISAFSDLIYYTYFDSLLAYSGQQTEFVGEIVNTKGDRVEVQTNFIHEGRPVSVNYRSMQKNGNWLVYDIIIENISMVQNYRTQFQDALQRQSPEEVTARIRARADETKARAEATIFR